MKKFTMWMVLMAMAVSPIFAQEGEPSEATEEQQIEETIEISEVEEAVQKSMEETPVEEAVEQVPIEEAPAVDPAVVVPAAGLTEEQQVEQAIEEALGFESDEPVVEEQEIIEPEIEEESGDNNKNQHQYREVQTLMKGGGGGYGAISVGYSEVNALPTFQMGAQAEWIMGHGFGLGIAGVGFTSDFTPVGNNFYALSGGYGGLIMEPIILGWFPVHIALPVLIGGGGLASYATNTDPWDYDNLDPTFGEYAWFFVAEVGLEIEFNLVSFFRLSLFGNYRWTTDLNMTPMDGLGIASPYPVDPGALHGWSTGVRFKFGSF